jgi:hypothetical protein
MKIKIACYKHDKDGNESLVAKRSTDSFAHAQEIISKIEKGFKKHIL